MLGYFGINWSKENKQELRDAQTEIVTCTEVAGILMAKNDTNVIAGELARLEARKQAAHIALTEASNFDRTVATVSFGALHFLVVGTILQAIAA